MIPAGEPGTAPSGAAGSPSAAVVICAYTERRWELLLEAVAATLGQTRPPDRLVLVIDHNAAMLERSCRHFPSELEVVPNASRQGLSGARNTGIELCAEEVVAFLDDDAIPEPEWLEQLLAGYGDGVLGVGGSIEPRWETSRPGWFPPEFDWVLGCTYLGMPLTAAPVRNLIGANMSLRREVFTRVGGFRDELARVGTLPFGCEETELCIRARQATPGGSFLYQPSARASHWVGAERTRFGYFRRQCFNEGRGKAMMAELVGSEDALSAERSHALRVLPAGILAGLRAALRERNPSGILRAAAIAAGALSAAAGYGATRLRRLRT